MAKEGVLKTIGIIAGTAVVSVVATRLFDRHVAPRLGLGGAPPKALPEAEAEEATQPQGNVVAAAPQQMQPNPYAALTPLPPPVVVPMPVMSAMPVAPAMPQWRPPTPPWMAQGAPQRNPRVAAVEEELVENEEEDFSAVDDYIDGLTQH